MFINTRVPNQFQGGWYLCHYIPGQWQNDLCTARLLDFKNNDANIIQHWGKWAGKEISETLIRFDYIIRSLGSSELTASGYMPLDMLCTGIKREINQSCTYIPNAIFKRRVTRKLSLISTRAEREQELSGVFGISSDCPDLNNKYVLIVDDISTSGTTSGEIVRTLKDRFPSANFYLFTLAQTLREENANVNVITPSFA